MDTSQDFQKMCLASDEIRNQRKSASDYFMGDFTDKGTVVDVHFELETVFVRRKNKDKAESFNCDELKFIPRMAQLVSLCGSHIQESGLQAIERLKLFIGGNQGYIQTQNLNSLERLWLAFYMKDKHRKLWDGAKWSKQTV